MLDTLASRWQCYSNTGTDTAFIGTAWRQISARQANKLPDGNHKILAFKKAPEKDTFNPCKVSATDIYAIIYLHTSLSFE